MISTSIVIDQNLDRSTPAYDVSRREHSDPTTPSGIIVHHGNESGFSVYDRNGAFPTQTEEPSDEKDASSELERPEKEDLSEAERNEVQKLEKTDREVRAHENAHMAAGAGLVRGSVSYEYQRGPDGNLYAVGGEVSIDTSEEQDPEDTVRKMQRVKAAALAPADPSPQDRRVAMQAAMKAAMAQVEIAEKRTLEKEPSPQQETDGDKHLKKGIQNYLKTTQEYAAGTFISTRT